ncbi:unnamed protein product [Psylliodes chrysocephalus]|uniref:Uncharacterized protein n=1 Tax=Psylliodes chrysocephalus TaxID=3402493 RepID=A0A9P0D143_9CUCU|nr:unnamed protein product [Psylliodes chrysocephala]
MNKKLNLTNISDLNNKSFIELNLEQLLSPEKISEITINAEVVFESSSELGILMRSPEEIANLEIMESTILDPTFEINNVHIISFAKLGNEECDLCESYQMHNPEHTAKSLKEEYEKCWSLKEHIEKATESLKIYTLNKENFIEDKDHLCVSVDLQKVSMLPRIEMFKKSNIFSSSDSLQ